MFIQGDKGRPLLHSIFLQLASVDRSSQNDEWSQVLIAMKSIPRRAKDGRRREGSWTVSVTTAQ